MQSRKIRLKRGYAIAVKEDTYIGEDIGVLVLKIRVFSHYDSQYLRHSTHSKRKSRTSNSNMRNKGQIVMEEKIRIRKLTPTECMRLMGFTDIDVERCQAVGMSNSQLYKQAGNSIVVSVLEAIFGQMFEGLEDEWKIRWTDPIDE